MRSLLDKKAEKETFLQDLVNKVLKNKKFPPMKRKFQKDLKQYMKETLTLKEGQRKVFLIRRNNTLKRTNSRIQIYIPSAVRLELSCLTVSPHHLKFKNRNITHSYQLAEVKIQMTAKHNT